MRGSSVIGSIAVTWPTLTCVSRNDAVVDAHHDVGVGDEVQAGAGAHAVDGNDRREPDVAVQRREAQFLVHVGLHRPRAATLGECLEIHAGAERAFTGAGDDDRRAPTDRS